MQENMVWYTVFATEAEALAAIKLNGARQIIAGGLRICLARTAQGFFAIQDACPHLGFSLSKGTFNYLNEAICPWHSYRYNLYDGQETDKRSAAARTFAVKIDENGLHVGIEG